MGLGVYRRKRDFKRTPEPRGAGRRRRGMGLSFYIQKHAASRLHYDFRLELDGVLLSWAVPKGPCLDPREKRLAVHVEDHPLDYGTFEGEIPRGEYGAGTVLLWDRGEWLPEGDPRAGYRKGHLKFRLKGRKLLGSWSLVAMGGRGGDRKNWLLIKGQDEAARPLSRVDVVEERPESVARPERIPAAKRSRRPRGKAKLPLDQQAQLATLAAKIPAGPGWLHEIKLDGYRILATISGGRARLKSRRGNDWSRRFKAIDAELEALPMREALLDGEVVLLDEKGRSDFQRLQNALREGADAPIAYFVFDLLFLDGVDLRDKPLLERKAALEKLLANAGSRVRVVDHIEGGDVFRSACRLGLEGVISKRIDAPYRPGRSDDWLKIKCSREQEFVIAGFTDPGGARQAFGALVLGVHDPDAGGDGLRYAGRVGTGFTQASLREIHAKLRGLETDASGFANPPKGADARGVHWIRPELVAQIAFAEWTKEGILRHPSFKGLREDKPAGAVTVERPGIAEVRITHPERVVYPEAGVTKLELARYYEKAAPRMLPYLTGRPLAIVRCPNGADKACFFQKHGSPGFPDSVKLVPIEEKDKESRENLYVEDLRGLLALVQFGVVEFHPWACKVGDVDRPDSMTFDLDPGPGVAWTAVLAAAREIRARFKKLGRETFVKTTGGKGLHVVVPLLPESGWPEVKAFAKAFADLLASDFPARYTSNMAKSGRHGRIFIDYLRNDRGSTSVCAYSTRKHPDATVSMPVGWEELKPSLKAGRFNVRNSLARLAGRKDPWRGFEAARRTLPRASP